MKDMIILDEVQLSFVPQRGITEYRVPWRDTTYCKATVNEDIAKNSSLVESITQGVAKWHA